MSDTDSEEIKSVIMTKDEIQDLMEKRDTKLFDRLQDVIRDNLALQGKTLEASFDKAFHQIETEQLRRDGEVGSKISAIERLTDELRRSDVDLNKKAEKIFTFIDTYRTATGPQLATLIEEVKAIKTTSIDMEARMRRQETLSNKQNGAMACIALVMAGLQMLASLKVFK